MLILLLACASSEPAHDVEDPPPDSTAVDAAIDTLAPCELGSDDGRLDIAGACADGACLGQTWPDMREVFGRTDCYAGTDSTTCVWDERGIVAIFPDADADGRPDDGEGATVLSLNLPFDGGTEGGLALDATARCFVEQLDEPDSVAFGATSDGWSLRLMGWSELYFSFYDFSDLDGVSGPDGYAEFVQFTAPGS